MKRRGCLIAIVLAVGLLGLAVYGFVQFGRGLEMTFSRPDLYLSLGTTKDCQAHFLEEGFQDRFLSLFVASSLEQNAAPKLVADLDWTTKCFDSAVWSRDGSVIACRANVVTEDAAEAAKESQGKAGSFHGKPDYLPFSCAYDFREKKSFVFKPNDRGSRQDWEAHSNAIKELLDSRGGPGKEITRQEIDRQKQKLDWAGWQVYRRAIYK